MNSLVNYEPSDSYPKALYFVLYQLILILKYKYQLINKDYIYSFIINIYSMLLDFNIMVFSI